MLVYKKKRKITIHIDTTQHGHHMQQSGSHSSKSIFFFTVFSLACADNDLDLYSIQSDTQAANEKEKYDSSNKSDRFSFTCRLLFPVMAVRINGTVAS